MATDLSRSVFRDNFKVEYLNPKKVRATSEPQSESAVDIVFVQCKAAHTKQAIMGAMSLFKQVKEVISY